MITIAGRRCIVQGALVGRKTLLAPVITSLVTSTTSIGLSWTTVTNGVTYTLQRATDNIFTQNLTSLYSGTGTSFSDTSRTTGTLYYYRVCASAPSYYNTSPYGVIAEMAGTSTTLTVGSGLTIDGNATSYAAGTTIHITGGTFAAGISLNNLTNVVIDATGVILDGLSNTSDGYFNVVSLSNCNNIIVRGYEVKDCGYLMGYIDQRALNIVFDRVNYNNCTQGFNVTNSNNLAWDGTNASTLNIIGATCINSTFTNCDGSIGFGGTTSGTDGSATIINGTRNIVVSGNTWTGGNPDNILVLFADYCEIYNNRVDALNLDRTNDVRAVIINGWGKVYNNYVTNIWGHFCALWPISFHGSKETSSFDHNICLGSLKYSTFEFQEVGGSMGTYSISGDLNIDSNTCGDLNTTHYEGFDGNFVDSYQFGTYSGVLNVNNNLGYNFFNVPPTNPSTGRPYVSNNGPVTGDINNKYEATQSLALDSYLNSLFSGIGAM